MVLCSGSLQNDFSGFAPCADSFLIHTPPHRGKPPFTKLCMNSNKREKRIVLTMTHELGGLTWNHNKESYRYVKVPLKSAYFSGRREKKTAELKYTSLEQIRRWCSRQSNPGLGSKANKIPYCSALIIVTAPVFNQILLGWKWETQTSKHNTLLGKNSIEGSAGSRTAQLRATLIHLKLGPLHLHPCPGTWLLCPRELLN